MKIFIYCALAATLCVAPAMAQPQEGPPTFIVQPDGPGQREGKPSAQIKADLQFLATSISAKNSFPSAENYVIGARSGFFGFTEWQRNLKGIMNGSWIQVEDVEVFKGDENGVKAAVSYSFKPMINANEDLPEFLKGTRQELLTLKFGPMPFDTGGMVWQIVPPEIAPPAFIPSDNSKPQDNLFANIAYYLAQKQVLEIPGTLEQRSVNNLKQLGLGVAQLVQDYTEVYAFAPRYLIEALTPYIGDSTVFLVPDTNEIYSFNANLSGLKLADINEVYKTVLFYEGQNEKPIFRYDGKAAICFADGHVALVTPDEAKSLIWKP